MNNATTLPPLKQGPVIGGAICFGLGTAIMSHSLCLMPLCAAILLVAFIFSIVAISQKRLMGGLVLLFATATVGSASNDPPYSDDLAHADAAAIKLLSSKRLDEPTSLTRPRPCFAPDGKTALYGRISDAGDSTSLIVRDLDSGQIVTTSTTPRRIRTMAWSPDSKKAIFFDDNRNLCVADLEAKTESVLPFSNSHIAGDELMLWRADAVLFFGIYSVNSLGLDDLKFTEQRYDSNQPRDVQILRMTATPIDHPKCYVYQTQIQNRGAYVGDYLMVMNKDCSYAHPLASGFHSRREIAVGPDLRHVLVADEAGLSVYYLGVRDRPPNRFSIDAFTSSPTNSEGVELFRKCLSQGVPFRGTIYSPETNPLNGKVVGPNRKDPKGWVRVTNWSQELVTVQTVLEIAEIRPGDVVADVTSDSVNENGYHSAGFGDQWRPISVNTHAPETALPMIGNKYITGIPNKSPHDPGSFSYTLREEKQSLGSTTNKSMTALPRDVAMNTTPSAPRLSAPNTERQASGEPTPPPDARLPGERFPESKLRVFPEAEVQSWSEAKLQYVINEIFARHGAEFGDKAVTKWFSQFKWYHPKRGISYDEIEASLSDIERRNVEILGTIRNQKKEKTKQKGSGHRNQRPVAPNPVAETILESILRGVQQGLESRR